MASPGARGALVAALARAATVSLLAGLYLQPVPALAAAGVGHTAVRGNSGRAPGHNNPASRVTTGRGGLATVVVGASAPGAAAATIAPVSTAVAPPASGPAPAPAARAAAALRLRSPALRPAPRAGGGADLVAFAAPVPALVQPARPDPGPESVPLPVVLPPGAEGQRVAIALFTLPLLLAVWLWALARLSVSVWRQRASGIRAALALQLGVPAEQLAGLDMTGLRRLRDGIAFDELTGVLRRAAGLASMDRELARSARAEHPVSVAFIDVDGLKATNDSLGHEAGDALLRRVASLLRGRLRAQDLIFRYGGDEFVAVLPGTPRQRAERLIEELRRGAAGTVVGFSYGVVQANRGETAADVIARADSLQYDDKQRRRAGR